MGKFMKLLLNISKLSIDLETDYPIILLEKEKIKLKKFSTTYDLKSFLKRKRKQINIYSFFAFFVFCLDSFGSILNFWTPKIPKKAPYIAKKRRAE